MKLKFEWWRMNVSGAEQIVLAGFVLSLFLLFVYMVGTEDLFWFS